MGSSSSASGFVDQKFILEGPVLNLDQQLDIVRPFTSKDIKEAYFSIGNSKSPGLDGFGAGFFKASWPTIGKDMVAAINEFFTSCNLPKVFSAAIMVLIPKNDNPSNACDFRPISYCSTIYKCVAKLICNRLNSVLPPMKIKVLLLRVVVLRIML